MNKRYSFYFYLMVFIIPLASCASGDQYIYLNDQIVALNRRVRSMEDAVDTKINRDLDARFASIRSNQADVRSDLEKMQAESKRLSGRIEEYEYLLKRSVERDLGDQNAVKGGISQLSQRVTELEATIKQQQASLTTLLSLAQEKKEQKEPPRQEVTAPAAPPPPPITPPVDVKLSEQELYDRSLATFREGKHEEAINGFQEFLKKYPKSDLCDNAQFWVGESHMALKQYEMAILAYQDVIKKYPNGNKVPNAILQQAQGFIEIKDKTSATLLLQKIIKSYPNTNESRLAQRKLETLK